MTGSEALRPLPDRHDPLLAPYWEGARSGTILIQRCGTCGELRWPPRPACTSCWSLDVEWSKAAGLGVIHSWVTIHHAFSPAFADAVPYHVVIVELDEGVRLVAGLEDADAGSPAIGQRVVARFSVVTDDVVLPMFIRAASASDGIDLTGASLP